MPVSNTDHQPGSLSRRGLLGAAAATAGAGLLSACAGQTPEGAARPAGTAAWREGQRSIAKIGLQLYTLREAFWADPAGTLRMLAEVGYDEIEYAHLDPMPLAPREFRRIVDDLGMTVPSAHFNPPIHFGEPQKVIDICGALGAKTAVNPWIVEPDRTPDGYRRQAAQQTEAARRMRAAGLRYAYHNHDFEFAVMEPGKTGYDILMENTDPALVDMEMDMCWVAAGGASITGLAAKYPGRFKLCHIKDWTTSRQMAFVGKGAINWAEAMAAGPQMGLEYFFVEHDSPPKPERAGVAEALAYLRALRF